MKRPYIFSLLLAISLGEPMVQARLDIVMRFRQEIKSPETADSLTEQEVRILFPDLAQEEDGLKKIKDFIDYFAANIRKKTITKKSRHGFFVNTQELYCYPAQATDNEPFLSACACSNFLLEDRILVTLKQLNNIVKKYPDKSQQLVHTSLAAGGAGKLYGCALLQLFMLVKGLVDFGYQKLFVKPIDEHPGNDIMYGDVFMHFLKELYGDMVSMHIVKIDAPFDPSCVPNAPYLVFKPYKDAHSTLQDEKAPKSHSFDIIDLSTGLTDKQFCACIENTSTPEALIYDGNGNKATRLSLEDITERSNL